MRDLTSGELSKVSGGDPPQSCAPVGTRYQDSTGNIYVAINTTGGWQYVRNIWITDRQEF